MQEEAEAERAKLPSVDSERRGYIVGGSSQAETDYGMSLLRADESGDFSEPLKSAAMAYAEDRNPKNPNQAFKEFWPSGAKYKSIFHRMGKVLGEAAAQKLAGIKDSELRLLAQIELAAGLSGLPEMASMTQHRRPSF